MVIYMICYRMYNLVVGFREFFKAMTGSTDADDMQGLFQDYALYRLGNWFTYSSFASLRVLIGIFISMVIFGTLAFVALANHGVATSLYQIFVWLVAPDGGALESTTGGLAVGAIISLCGLLLLALLMTVVGAMFEQYIDGLKAGTTPVLETEHTVILGFTDDTIPLVQELCSANEDFPTTIAILSELPKPEVERRLDEADLLVGEKLKGSRVVVRTGFPHRPEDLKLVSTDLCRSVIPMPERTVEKDTRDAYMLQVVAAVTSGENWPRSRGKVLILYAVDRNSDVFSHVGGDKATTVNLDGLISSVLVSCSNQKQTAKVISDFLSFDGSEFHIAKVPKWLIGKRIDEIELYYPSCTIVGVINREDDSPELCLNGSFRVEKGQDLVVLAEDRVALKPSREPAQIPTMLSEEGRRRASRSGSRLGFFDSVRSSISDHREEYVLVVGWSYIVGSVLAQLDGRVPPGTTIASFADTSPEHRNLFLQKALKRHRMEAWKNIQIEFYQGLPASSYQLEEAGVGHETCGHPKGWHFRAQTDEQPDFSACGIRWAAITRVFVLADHTATDQWRSDAIGITAALQVRNLIDSKVPVVVETLDVSSRELCERLGLQDVVSSATLPAQVMATLSVEPRLKEVLLQVLAHGNHEVHLAPIRHYWTERLPMQNCFHIVASAVRKSGDLLVGWDIAPAGGEPASSSVFTYNPDRFEQVEVTRNVTLVVLACRTPSLSRQASLESPSPNLARAGSRQFSSSP